MYVCWCIHMFTYMYSHIFVYTYTYMYVRICTYIHIYTYMFTYMHKYRYIATATTHCNTLQQNTTDLQRTDELHTLEAKRGRTGS